MRQSFAVGFLVSAFAGALEVFASAPEWQGRLDAPEWPDVKPEYYDHSKDPACRVVGAYFKGKFVSALDDVSGQGKSGRKFMLRRRFDLKSVPAEAWLQGIADSSATFRINGREAMKAWYSYLTSRNRTFVKNVGKMLKAGRNELEIEYTVDATCDNAKRTFPGGAILELFVRYSDGSFERIDSDGLFESSSDGRCNGIMGVPITFLDKYNPEQFEIIGLDRYVEDNPRYGHRFTINGRETYARVLIKHKM